MAPELQEGIDYVIEDGLLVFTAEYLRKRGYCCGSGCRNCPYRVPDSENEKAPKPRPASGREAASASEGSP